MSPSHPGEAMTLERAVQVFRSLQWSAGEGWPMGEPDDLREQCREALAAIDAYVESFPDPARSAQARQILRRIESREHVATVAPRKARQAAPKPMRRPE